MYKGGNADMNRSIPLRKVLLVDDEPYIRKGLAALIDWEAEGCMIAGEASDGNSAIRLLQQQEFDIVISDIRMPEMDGIEFITNVKNRQLSKARFIFLSGFYDFSYAKSAIQCGCCDYIIKPVNKSELLEAIRRIQDDYQKEEGSERKKQDYEKAYLDSHLTSIIWGKFDSVNLKYVQDKMILSNEITYIHCEIALSDKSFLALSVDKKREQQRRLYYFAGMLLKKYANHVVYDITKNTESYDIGIIFCPDMAKERGYSQEEWMSWLMKELSERMGYEIIGCAGSKVDGITSISDSYRDAVLIRSLRYYKKSDLRSVRQDKCQNVSKGQREDDFSKQMDRLVHVIEINDKVKMKAYSGEVYRGLTDQRIAVEVINHDIQYLMYRLLGLAYSQDNDIDQDEILQYVRDAILRLKTNYGNEIKFQQFTEEYSDYLTHLRQNTAKGMMYLIEAEIEEKYADNISLKYLGEKYFLNSAYLGQVFKKQYGCSFKDYLNKVRIRKAAEMMLRTNMKVYEIAMEVGYKNIEYFVTKFEEVYEMTPTRFRKRSMQGNNIS
jgi:two-component system response regulator YesN